jgi:hypothetical protein
MKRASRALLVVGALILLAPPAAAQESDVSHEVRAGDTLWDLAARYLSDPFRWPEIYSLNPGIVEDPHWIFPGELLQLPGAKTARAVASREAAAAGPGEDAAVAAQRSTARPAQEVRRTTANERAGEYPEGSIFRRDPNAPDFGALSLAEAEPHPVVSRSDFYGASLLTDRETMPMAGSTERVVAEKPLDLKLPTAARPYQEVVIRLDTPGVEVGDHLQAVRWGRRVKDSGHVLQSMAHLQVTRVYTDSVRAEVVSIFGDYQVGDPVIAAGAFTVEPGIRAEPEAAGPIGRVVGYEVEQTLLGTGEKLFIDLGTVDGVKTGDEFVVFSASELHPDEARIDDRLATVRVVRATETTATAMVIELRDAGMRPGVPVRRVGRMPL